MSATSAMSDLTREAPSEARAIRGLDDLSGPARHLVEVGAVLGASFSVADAARALGQPVGGVLAAVQETVDAGVLVPTPGALEFRDGALRDAAYEAVPAALALALHRQIGELLLDRCEWAAAADHLMHGVDAGDRVAAAGLEQVAREVLTSTPEWASELALRALAITDAGDVDRFDRAATAVESLVTAGRLGEAHYLARRALLSHGVPPPAAARLRLALARLSLFAGRPRAALDEICDVVSDPLAPGPLRALADLCLLWATNAVDDRSGAARHVEAILSGGAGRDEVLPPTLATIGMDAWRHGVVGDGLALARAAVLRGERQPPALGGPFGRLSLASMLTALGDLDEAARLVEVVRDEITSGRQVLWTAAPAVAAARADLAAGRVDDARASAHAAIELATELGTPCFLSSARTVLAEVAVMGGELSEAAAHLERGGPAVAWPPWAASGRRLAEARLAEAKGGPDTLLAQSSALYDDVAADARLLLDDPAAAAWLVRTALAAGDRGRAERVLAHAEHLARVNASFPAVVAAWWHARGLVEDDPQLVLQAGAAHRHASARAAAWEDAGALVLGTDRSAAKELLERAVVAYQHLGAERDAARVRSRLWAIGVRWRHGRRTERPVSGWGSLTDSERAVAEHVAEGLTNAQVAERMYLSRHTVDFNLRQVFRKLAISSRVALARQQFEREHESNADGHGDARPEDPEDPASV